MMGVRTPSGLDVRLDRLVVSRPATFVSMPYKMAVSMGPLPGSNGVGEWVGEWESGRVGVGCALVEGRISPSHAHP